jgi:hypothetical protein
VCGATGDPRTLCRKGIDAWRDLLLSNPFFLPEWLRLILAVSRAIHRFESWVKDVYLIVDVRDAASLFLASPSLDL